MGVIPSSIIRGDCIVYWYRDMHKNKREHWCKCSLCGSTIRKGEYAYSKFVCRDEYGGCRMVHLHASHVNEKDLAKYLDIQKQKKVLEDL